MHIGNNVLQIVTHRSAMEADVIKLLAAFNFVSQAVCAVSMNESLHDLIQPQSK